MRKKLFVVFCAFLAPVFSAAQSHDPFEADTTEFVLTVGSLSMKAMDAYPQRITGLSKDGKGYRVVLTVVNPYADSARRAKMMEAPYSRNRSYDGETILYLLPTPLIDPENELLAGIADTLFTDESSAFAVINKALSFTHGFYRPTIRLPAASMREFAGRWTWRRSSSGGEALAANMRTCSLH